jgi:hypothetical protein
LPTAETGQPCPGCGGRSTEDTLACPWCGRPLNGGARNRGWTRVLAILFVLAVLAGGLGWLALHYLGR